MSETRKPATAAASSRLLRLPQVSALVGLSRSAILARVVAGTFPQRVSLGARAIAWRESGSAATGADSEACGPTACQPANSPPIRGRSEQIAASRKKTRGLGAATQALRHAILRCVLAPGSQAAPWTVRQVFYAMTVAGAVEKTEAGYDRVQRQVLALRRERALPYDRIAASTRWVRRAQTFSSLADWATVSLDHLRLDLWRDSGERVEIWCEKDALAGVIADVCYRWHVPLYVARGYASESYLYEAALGIANDSRCTAIYHVGDLDPSGVDAADKIRDRLAAFVAELTGDEAAQRVTFTRLAVTPQQVCTLKLPSRPTKRTDTRAAGFARRFGNIESTELDAMSPAQLCEMIEDAIFSHVDREQVANIADEEREARALAVRIADAYRSGEGA